KSRSYPSEADSLPPNLATLHRPDDILSAYNQLQTQLQLKRSRKTHP
ncbi:MAG: hypothetical protein HC904_15735, partial [Blastochloris sp.]|nr:hypothetical protein [Blastochloris sp.]